MGMASEVVGFKHARESPCNLNSDPRHRPASSRKSQVRQHGGGVGQALQDDARARGAQSGGGE